MIQRSNDINLLSKRFRQRFDPFRQEIITKYPNAVVFETLRTRERQARLYEQGRTRPGNIVTWTLNSNHFTGDAVDIVFRNIKTGALERQGPYMDLIDIARKYGIRNLYPRETCHFEFDDTIEYGKQPMGDNMKRLYALNSIVYDESNDKALQTLLNNVNNHFRSYYNTND